MIRRAWAGPEGPVLPTLLGRGENGAFHLLDSFTLIDTKAQAHHPHRGAPGPFHGRHVDRRAGARSIVAAGWAVRDVPPDTVGVSSACQAVSVISLIR